MRRVCALSCAVAFLFAIRVATQPAAHRAPRLWTDGALKEWALPIAGVNATPRFHTESEYYAAPIDELRTYPVYVKGKEPAGYRDELRERGPQPLIELNRARTVEEWAAAGREIFEGLDVPETRTDDPRVFEWLDDPSRPTRERALVTGKGEILSLRWVVDRDRKLKLTLSGCGSCHTRVLSDGTAVLGAQGNLNFGLSILPVIFQHRDAAYARQGRPNQLVDALYSQWGVPWLADDVHARLKTMAEPQARMLFMPATITPGTFPRANGSPWFTNRIPDLIGVRDRRYLDATATHRNRGPEDIARYAIHVTDEDDGAVGPYTFVSNQGHVLPHRHSDDAMYAVGQFVYSLEPPINPNRPDAQTDRGQQVFASAGCVTCHTPPLYTNNKLVAVEGFVRLDHPQSPPVADVMDARLGLDPGLALRTRKGTGYYKVPSLRGLWYRDTLEHSGSVRSLEEWFDSARLSEEYRPKGFNPPGTRTRPPSGHRFGLDLSDEDKRALIAFLRTL